MALDLSSLNEAQKNAVTDTEGAVLVFAGAGSGKTRVLTYRVAYLIQELNVPSYNILAITFTKKATNEMKERLAVMLGTEHRVHISTFHSLCVTILRIYADRIGFTQDFSIFDDSDGEKVIKKILREKHEEEDKYLSKIKFHITSAKNQGLTPDEYFATIRTNKDAVFISECYERYQQHLQDNNAMDYNDLLYNLMRLFRVAPDVMEKYQSRFRYILVDEFQDTNEIQLEILKTLSQKWGNLFVVGDDDQSIYGWRGAQIENILGFGKSFQNAKIHKLTQNYRSTARILQAANNLISHNKNRTEKELFTDIKGGVKVEYLSAYNDHKEAETVVETIRNLKRYNGYQNKDFAILVRLNALTRLFENKLTMAGLSYRVFGGQEFFGRKEILDVLAYLRVLSNHYDNEALLRIINVPKRGIGDGTIEELERYCLSEGKSLFDGIMDLRTANTLSSSARKKLEPFYNLLCDLMRLKNDLNLYNLIVELVRMVGFEFELRKSGKEEDENRWENIVELVNQTKEFCDTKPDATLGEFLQTVVVDNDTKKESGDYVTLANTHKIKGLEFKVVFISCCEENIFPSAKSLAEENGLEEERRVMYVAITRAMERLYISFARNRFRFNQTLSCTPSRFINEAKGYQDVPPERPMRERDIEKIGFDEAVPTSPRKPAFIPEPKISYIERKVYNDNLSGFRPGAKVLHQRYGKGTVVMVEGSGTGVLASVAFPGLGVKKFAVANAPLKLLDE